MEEEERLGRAGERAARVTWVLLPLRPRQPRARAAAEDHAAHPHVWQRAKDWAGYGARTYCRNGGHHLAQLELVQDGGLGGRGEGKVHGSVTQAQEHRTPGASRDTYAETGDYYIETT